MRKFILIISDTDETRLSRAYPKVVEGLRQASPKVLPLLLPHLILFEADGELEKAAHIVRSILEASDHFLVVELHHTFLGALDFERMTAATRFFDP